MIGLATDLVSVLRGTAETPIGDEVDDNDAPGMIVDGLGNVPASFIETAKDVDDPATGTPRTVRRIKARLPLVVAHPDSGEAVNVTLLEGDRIKRLRDGRIYNVVEKVTVPRSVAGLGSLRLDLTDTAP